MDYRIVCGFILFIIAQCIAWYQLNSQFVWDYWKDKAILSSVLFSVPVALCFWYATKNIYAASGALWTCRFVGFASGILVFTVLTWIHLDESMLTVKTMLCLVLSFAILLIQVLMK